MTVHDKPYPVVEYRIGVFGDWLNHRRELNELRLLDTGQFQPDRRRFADFRHRLE